MAEALEAPLLLVPEFEEVDFGLWEGLTWQQIGERYPKEYAGWRREPVEHPPVGGEGRESASLRAKRGLEILFEKSGERTRLWWPTGPSWPISGTRCSRTRKSPGADRKKRQHHHH